MDTWKRRLSTINRPGDRDFQPPPNVAIEQANQRKGGQEYGRRLGHRIRPKGKKLRSSSDSRDGKCSQIVAIRAELVDRTRFGLIDRAVRHVEIAAIVETPYYTDRERAALAWTETVTEVANTHIPDAVYEVAREQFGEKELIDLTLAVVAINGWNRLAISFRKVPGTYQPTHR